VLRRRVAAAGLDDAVAFAGRREDAVELMAGSDVVAVPTVPDERNMGREGFGFVGVEAMAVGTPVVGYADGALPEVLGDCARLVAPGDTRALGDAIAELLADEAVRRRMGDCGRARARERFTADRMVDAMRDAYRDAAATPQASPPGRRRLGVRLPRVRG
jgi:glycosyltransferase involved in cell wall biosynthesis